MGSTNAQLGQRAIGPLVPTIRNSRMLHMGHAANGVLASHNFFKVHAWVCACPLTCVSLPRHAPASWQNSPHESAQQSVAQPLGGCQLSSAQLPLRASLCAERLTCMALLRLSSLVEDCELHYDVKRCRSGRDGCTVDKIHEQRIARSHQARITNELVTFYDSCRDTERRRLIGG